MRIQPEKMIGWVGVVPISEASAVYSVIFPHFSQTKGQKQKASPFEIHF